MAAVLVRRQLTASHDSQDSGRVLTRHRSDLSNPNRTGI